LVKGRLTARQIPFKEKAAGLAKKLEQQKKQAGLDNPLGTYLGLTNENLASFYIFDRTASPDKFIEYLNSLKKNAGIKKWPLLSRDDDEADLAAKFQEIHDLCMEKNPEAQSKLTVGNTNYFSFVWQSLKEIEKTRQDKKLVQKKIDNLQKRLNAVPGTLDEVAYVGLFIIDPPKPGLEMIRFEGP
jgi:hypothetical protein